MTISSFRTAEPLYIVTIRGNSQAESLFKSWLQQQSVSNVFVQNHRLLFHDNNAFEKFRLTWSHGEVTVWDTWNRRHVYLD
jgi:hypothetical protein